MALVHDLTVDPHDDTVVGSGPQSDPFRAGGEPHAAPADEVVTGRPPELVEKGQIDVRRPFLGGGELGNVESERVGRRSQGIVEAARQPAGRSQASHEEPDEREQYARQDVVRRDTGRSRKRDPDSPHGVHAANPTPKPGTDQAVVPALSRQAQRCTASVPTPPAAWTEARPRRARGTIRQRSSSPESSTASTSSAASRRMARLAASPSESIPATCTSGPANRYRYRRGRRGHESQCRPGCRSSRRSAGTRVRAAARKRLERQAVRLVVVLRRLAASGRPEGHGARASGHGLGVHFTPVRGRGIGAARWRALHLDDGRHPLVIQAVQTRTGCSPRSAAGPASTTRSVCSCWPRCTAVRRPRR